MRPKFGNTSISTIEVIINSVLVAFDQKKQFVKGWSWFQFNNLGLALGMALKFYTRVAKRVKLKVKKFLGLIPVCRSYREKTGRGPFWLSPFWLGLRLAPEGLDC